ncbi:MAG: PilZ domain-containing protein [Vicinamibacterales bacterium]
MKTPSTDRRAHERYDVLGALWGVLELPESARVVNVSKLGLLIEADLSPVLNSVHAVRMVVDGDPVRVDAIVRHCRRGPFGRNLIGLEFLEVPTTVLSSLEQLGADKQIEVIDSGASRP